MNLKKNHYNTHTVDLQVDLALPRSVEVAHSRPAEDLASVQTFRTACDFSLCSQLFHLSNTAVCLPFTLLNPSLIRFNLTHFAAFYTQDLAFTTHGRYSSYHDPSKPPSLSRPPV